MKLNKSFLSVAAILVLLLAGILSSCTPPVPEVIDVTGVEIVEEDQSMKVDETLQLTAIVTPEDATNKVITWESDNPDVAAVDENGLVTALKSGTANITVTTEDGTFTDMIKITVTKPTPAPYPTPTPTPDKYTLTTTVLPADSGTVTGEGEYEQGDEVSITATSADGYEFVNWTAPAGIFADETNTDTTFTMPATDVTVTANFAQVYEVTFGAVELIEDIPDSINSRLMLRRETSPSLEPNLAGVEIEIFSDVESTNSVGVITTDGEGMATVKLPAGTYYYNASKDEYADFPGVPDDTTNIWQYFLREILEEPETGISFTVPLEDSSEVMPCIMLKVWPVTFTAVGEFYFGVTGISRDINAKFQVPTLEEVSIEIYPEVIFAIDFLFSSERTKEIAKKRDVEPMSPLMTTLTTDNSGIAQINLPSGFYLYTAEKDGYEFMPDGALRETRSEVPEVSISTYDLFFVIDEPTNVLFGMISVPWTVTFMVGDEVIKTQTIFNGEIIGNPPEPTKDNCTLIGWSTVQNAESEDQLFDTENTPITEDITLYAQWACLN